MLNGKNVLLAVTGSIAAYKAAFIIRELITKGAHVRLIMTESACDFITPLTLSTLAKSPVVKDFVKNDDTGEWNNHVELGIWADLMLIAPATANTLAKLVTGHADSFLLATYLSAKCPVFVAPAMDLDMYKHPSTQENIKTLIKRKVGIIYPESGELASGLIGEGRLAEPQKIVKHINQYFLDKASLKGKKVLISAGPTYESLDPVRFIGNHSSGKMGFSLSKIASKRGAEVTLIAGPVELQTPEKVKRIDVKSADQMFNAMKAEYANADIVIMAAAVADYTIANPESEKIKKKDQLLEIKLQKTKDILKYLGENKKDQILVGFALETENELVNAKEKLKKKNLDAIVLNSLKDAGAGFGADTNKITIITRDNKIISFELKEKLKVAEDIFDFIEGTIK